jgi:hypothetical protein
MKTFPLYLAVLLIGLITTTAFADIKIKSRQTISGQSYENTTYIKGKRERAERNMGGLKIINLTQCDLKRDIQMNEQTKTYLINSFIENVEIKNNQKVSATPNDNVIRSGGTITSTVTYKDTGERRRMFGYEAKHIITTLETVSSPDACAVNNKKMQFDGWYIDAEFALDCQNNRYVSGNYKVPPKSGCQDKYQMKTIGNAKRGYPVYEKMSMFDQNGKELTSTVSEVLEFSKATLDDALFEVPQDYRKVSDMTALYNTSSISMNSDNSASIPMNSDNGNSNSGTLQNIRNQVQNAENPSSVETKKEGVTRIGIIVKTGAVGEGLNTGELAAAVQNTLGEYLKGTNIELIPLEAKLASAINTEAAQKECDFVLLLNASHKKGKSGGFGGMFGKVIAPAVGQTGIGHTGSTAGNIAGQIATQAIISAGSISANVKSKDEITLAVKLQKTNAPDVLNKEFKAKAKSDGEDIISPLIEQIAENLLSCTK